MIDVSLDAGDFVMTNLAYGLYLGISIAMTVWVARALSSNGEVFLVRCFGQDTELAASTNRLLVIGFYLVNLGFISYRLGNWQVDSVDLIPDVGSRVGVSLLVLGLMHFFNMILIARFGRAVKNWAQTQELAAASAAGVRARPMDVEFTRTPPPPPPAQ
ncbi:hypothetical protein [Dokdonella sp.]|jgi:hypothetical protein|uniref:hypothetical protein n=1 Tax=Dokdonella sp. TaxID=2291710 RepID=UPI001B5AFBC7|nr:hypothetical protein [Dokdonella sp.]MBP6327404.1 hypothetical protein [Dokdonella sp.]MBP6329729.1 hypothetical protein [Dokdonella sp.]HNV08448.1 hypothetical protein [Dokdonella sp.]HPW03059.1 hypothetical protein [Dokdonella sp.]HQV48112.1 hypothetical protein [Dokdonella sp.]